MATLHNLTPHDVVILTDHGRLVLPPTTTVARVIDNPRPDGHLTIDDHFPVELVATTPGNVIDLPQPKPGAVYVVSRLVAERCPHRHDLVYPADLVRTDDGTIIACRRLARLATTSTGSP